VWTRDLLLGALSLFPTNRLGRSYSAISFLMQRKIAGFAAAAIFPIPQFSGAFG
jgi:hypothetical protein